MEHTMIPRVATSFNLRSDVLNILEQKARHSNRTLNAYIESVLFEDAYADEPNATTRQAIAEAQAGKRDTREIYDNVDAMMKDLLEV